MQNDILIIGSGVAGLSAGLYAGRYGMKTVIVGKQIGGESASGGIFWNYPGARAVDGYDLAKTMKGQAVESGCEILDGTVVKVAKNESGFIATLADGKELSAKVAIFAMGMERRKLGLPREHELTGKGVHYCVTCDGPVYFGKTVAVIGGGDAAVKGVHLLGQFANKIYLIIREPYFMAEPANVAELKRLGDRVVVIMETEVKEIVGGEKLEKIVLTKPHEGVSELAVDGMFVEIGAVPNAELPASLGIATDKWGFVNADAMMTTNVAGAFAAGDTVNTFGSFKQAITSAASGALAATSAYKFIKDDRK